MVTPNSSERRLVPIACSLGPSDGAARLAKWRRIAAASGLGQTTEPGRVTIRFRDDAGVANELHRLVAAERDCCAFLGWALVNIDGECRVEVSGSDEELQTLPLYLADQT